MPKEEAIEELREVGRELELNRIKKDLAYYRCSFDSWISEKWILSEGLVEDSIEKMKKMGLLYEKDGALWFESSKYGDDKDRVLVKSDGYYTSLTPDIANHIHKFDRG